MKVLDFSADNDHEPDSNTEYTRASLDVGLLPESFTICSAFMVTAWNTKFSSAKIFELLDTCGMFSQFSSSKQVDWDKYREWGYVHMYAAPGYTEYTVRLGPVSLVKQTTAVFFPLQWTRVCLSVDSVVKRVALVVDGQLLGEEEYKREEDRRSSANVNLVLGFDPLNRHEYTGRVSNLNMFNRSLPEDMLIELTTAGKKDCEASGDFVSWEKAKWTLHSQAKLIEVDREWEGPCRRESQVQVFTGAGGHRDCMEHCQKIVNGTSPPLNSKAEWQSLTKEVELITTDRDNIGHLMWLSATEGDKDNKLERLGHWPEREQNGNETSDLEAVETIWRDFYSGQRLDNWKKPYYKPKSFSTLAYKDNQGNTSNCMALYLYEPWERSWYETKCNANDLSCPCSYPTQPLLRMLGLCSYSMIDNLLTPKQLYDSPDMVMLVGQKTTKIEYNDTNRLWLMTGGPNLNGISRSGRVSIIGKHNWTIFNDASECNEGQPYNTTLKLTGCREDEFTCDDGQCIKMERRGDQVQSLPPSFTTWTSRSFLL